jgi:hypothetical protein
MCAFKTSHDVMQIGRLIRFAEFDAAVWDRQFERDVTEGRLGELADEALRYWRRGQFTDL